MVGGEIGGKLLGHALNFASAGAKTALKIGSMGVSTQIARARASGLANVDQVLTAAVLNPEIARTLLLRPAATARPAVLAKLRGLLSDFAADGMLTTSGGNGDGR